MKKKFHANGKTYDIPENEISSFLKDFPNAEEVKSYDVNGKKYDIPLSQTSAFESDMGLKKKEATPPPVSTPTVPAPAQKQPIAAPVVSDKPESTPAQPSTPFDFDKVGGKFGVPTQLAPGDAPMPDPALVAGNPAKFKLQQELAPKPAYLQSFQEQEAERLRSGRFITVPTQAGNVKKFISFNTIPQAAGPDFVDGLQNRIKTGVITQYDANVIAKNEIPDLTDNRYTPNDDGILNDYLRDFKLPKGEDEASNIQNINTILETIQKNPEDIYQDDSGFAVSSLSDSQKRSIERLNGIKYKLAKQALNNTPTIDAPIDALQRDDNDGNNLKSAIRHVFDLASRAAGTGEQSPLGDLLMGKQYSDNRVQLKNEFWQGLEFYKTYDPVLYERVYDQVKQGLPMSQTQIATIESMGTKLKKEKADDDLLADKITVDQHGSIMGELYKASLENTYKHPEVLRASLAGDIADAGEKDAISKGEDPDAIWSYSDDFISKAAKESATKRGLDPDSREVQDAIRFLQRNEGILPMQNSIAKRDGIRDLFEGLAEPIRGVTNYLDGKRGNDAYIQAQSAGSTMVADADLDSEKAGYLKYRKGIIKGAGQFATQAALAYAGTSFLSGVGGLLKIGAGVAAPASVAADGALATGDAITATSVIGEAVQPTVASIKFGSKVYGKARDFASTLMTSYAQVYDSNYKTAQTYTADDNTAAKIANVQSIMEGLSENLLSPLEVARGVGKGLFKTGDITKGLLKVFTESNILEQKNALKQFAESVFNGLKEGGKVGANEITEEFVTQTTDLIANAVYNPESFKRRDIANEYKDVAVQTGLTMVLPALMSGLGAANSNTLSKSMLLFSAQDRQTMQDQLDLFRSKNEISEKDYKDKSLIISTASYVNENLPVKNNGKELSSQEKEDFIFNRVSQKLIEQKLKNENKSPNFDLEEPVLLERQKALFEESNKILNSKSVVPKRVTRVAEKTARVNELDAALGQDVRYNGEVGVLQRDEEGNYVVARDNKEYILPLKDKNNPVEKTADLGLEVLPSITPEQVENAKKDAEQTGIVKSNNGNEFFISLANPNIDNEVGDQVMMRDKKGKLKQVPGMQDDVKLGLINKFLQEKGLPARTELIPNYYKPQNTDQQTAVDQPAPVAKNAASINVPIEPFAPPLAPTTAPANEVQPNIETPTEEPAITNENPVAVDAPAPQLVTDENRKGLTSQLPAKELVQYAKVKKAQGQAAADKLLEKYLPKTEATTQSGVINDGNRAVIVKLLSPTELKEYAKIKKSDGQEAADKLLNKYLVTEPVAPIATKFIANETQYSALQRLTAGIENLPEDQREAEIQRRAQEHDASYKEFIKSKGNEVTGENLNLDRVKNFGKLTAQAMKKFMDNPAQYAGEKENFENGSRVDENGKVIAENDFVGLKEKVKQLRKEKNTAEIKKINEAPTAYLKTIQNGNEASNTAPQEQTPAESTAGKSKDNSKNNKAKKRERFKPIAEEPLDERRSKTGVRYSDMFIGDENLTSIIERHNLSKGDLDQILSVFDRMIDYFKFDEKSTKDWLMSNANPEDITEVMEVMEDIGIFKSSDWRHYQQKNVENTQDALRFIANSKEGENGYTQKLIDAAKDIQKSIANQGSDTRFYAIDVAGELGLSVQTVENEQKPKVIKRKNVGNRVNKTKRVILNPIYRRALEIDSPSLEQQVMQYFIGGGQINSNVLKQLFGGQKLSGQKNIQKEVSSRIGLMDNKIGAKSIDDLAHALYEGQLNSEQYSEQDFREAVEQVLLTYSGKKAMAEGIVNDLDEAAKEEAAHYQEMVDGANADPQTVDEAIDVADQLTDEELQGINDETTDQNLRGLESLKQARIENAQGEVERSKDALAKAKADYEKKQDSFNKGQNAEKQTDLFGRANTASMFNDAADQNAIVKDAKKAFDAAQATYNEALQELQDAKDNVGQDELFAVGNVQSTDVQKAQVQKIIDFFTKGLKLNVFAPFNQFSSKLKELGYDSLQAMVTAYHGSAYAFEKFTTSKIGTGEGTQFFGWGLYFTDVEAIARRYANIDDSPMAKKQLLEKAVPVLRDKLSAGEISSTEYTTAVNALNNFANYGTLNFMRSKNEMDDSIGFLKNSPYNMELPKRKLYKAVIHEGKSADQYDFMEWGKVVKESQADKIIKGLKEKGINAKKTGLLVDFGFGDREQIRQEKGKDIYQKLSDLLGGDKEASDFLLSIGVDGIKYPTDSLNQTQNKFKNAGNNYVVFDENAVAIKERVEFLATPKGEVLGFVSNGKVYLNPNSVTPETVFHELTHVQQAMIQLAADKGDKQAAAIISKFDAIMSAAVAQIKAGKRVITLSGQKIDLGSKVYDQGKNETDAAYNARLRNEVWAYVQAPANTQKWEKATTVNAIKNFIQAIKNWFKDKLGLKNSTDLQSLSLEQLIDRSSDSLMKGEYLNTKENKVVTEIKSKNLTHVPATNMGAKQAQGIYISTEAGNRYATASSPSTSVDVSITNPKVTSYVENTELQQSKLSDLIDRNALELEDISAVFYDEIAQFSNKKMADVTSKDVSKWYKSEYGDTVDEDVFGSTARSKAAQLITDQYKSEGYDSLYIPETKTTEGELVVFDRSNVQLKGEAQFAVAPNEINAFVDDLRNEGFTDDEIRDTLDEAGNSKAEIDAALKAPAEEPAASEQASTTPANAMTITHQSTENEREELGLPEREMRDRLANQELLAQADAEIASGYSAKRLVRDLLSGAKKVPSALESAILTRYIATLKSGIREGANNQQIKEYRDALEAAEKGGSEAGAALQARKIASPIDGSLADFFARDLDSNLGAPLTDLQRAATEAEFAEIEAAKKAYEEKIAALEAENAKLKAKKEFEAEKAKKKSTTSTNKKDYKSERKSIVEHMKQKLREANQQAYSTLPYLPQLLAVAPDVAKLVKSYVQEGVSNLADVISNIHTILKEDIPAITEKDVNDLIAGEYNAKPKVKSDVARQVFELKVQAALQNKLDVLLAGPIPKIEKNKIRYNQQVEALRKKINDLQKEYDKAQREANKPTVDQVQKNIIDGMAKDLQAAENSNPAITKEDRLAIVADDSAKLLRSYANDITVGLDEAVDNIFNALSSNIPGLTKGDVSNLIAGKYNKPSNVQSEQSKRVKEIRMEAQLKGKLNELLQGPKPKTLQSKPVYNQKITALKKQIDDLQKQHAKEARLANAKTPEQIALQSLKTRTKSQIAELEKELASGNLIEAPVKKVPTKLDKEALDLKDKLIKLKMEREVRLIKQEAAQRSAIKKVGDFSLAVLGAPRSILSSMDFSAPLRQGLIPTIAHPVVAVNAFGEMFRQAFSQKRFDRWFNDVREAPDFKTMEDSGLYVGNPLDPRMSAREEAFMSNLAEKIPLVGRLIKGSERAYVVYLNKMRVDLFRNAVEQYEQKGKTFENSETLYKATASWINNSTGRGTLSKPLQTAAPVLNSIFFSPRLIAARVNALNPVYYAKLPWAVRKTALMDMLKFVGFGVSVLALLKAAHGCPPGCKVCKNCFRVELDPRSTDFGKLRDGNKRYDIWGGFQPLIRAMVQFASGKTKSTTDGKIVTLGENEKGKKTPFGKTRASVVASFFRSKLAPVPGSIWNLIEGATVVGEPSTPLLELKRNTMPLIVADMQELFKDEGAKAIFTSLLPATFGVGVQNYEPKPKKTK